jgi:HTH-type transcriptional regulator/antitoxin HigA
MSPRIPAESFPPGEYLRDELDARDWSQSEFAEIIGRDTATVNRILSGKSQITADMACLFEEALDLDAEYWLNLESAYQLGIKRERTRPTLVTQKARLHDAFPVKQMGSRGWITKTDNIDVLYHNVFEFYRISSIDEVPSFLHAVKKTRTKKYSSLQLAWLCRTRVLAECLMVSSYTKSKLKHALVELRKALESPEEIRNIPRILADAGVRLLVVEPLKGSRIEGACFWLDSKSPVVALSLLSPTIDCFWFNLMHELFHVFHGHGKIDGPIVDEDIGNPNNTDEPQEEKLVNQEAEKWLIQTNVFDDFVMRHNPMFSRANILGFARRINVHPGIVAGRLHKKGIVRSWAIHAKLKTNVRNTVASSALCDGWGMNPDI